MEADTAAEERGEQRQGREYRDYRLYSLGDCWFVVGKVQGLPLSSW